MLAPIVAALLVQASGPGIATTLPAQQGMSASWWAASNGEGVRRVCLIEKARNREVCRSMDEWRRIAARIERDRAGQ